MHPEYRDTVPNISLYSVLFRLPFLSGDDDASCASNSDVGRQLRLAIEFFDKVVPNQPGFSSSIAALTILPDVQRLSMAWKKWFRCAGKVRRLNFIRKRLDKLREEQKSKNNVGDGQQNSNNGTSRAFNSTKRENSDLTNLQALESHVTGGSGSRNACTENDLEAALHAAAIDIKEESNMEMFLDDDEIEQMSVYYREYARRLVYNATFTRKFLHRTASNFRFIFSILFAKLGYLWSEWM